MESIMNALRKTSTTQRFFLAGGVAIALSWGIRRLVSSQQGALLSRVLAQSDVALNTGNLVPFKCNEVVVTDSNMKFLLSTLQEPPRKQKPMNYKQSDSHKKLPSSSPFLPPDLEEPLLVGDYMGYNLILNKYVVKRGHFLLCTKQFENQTDGMNAKDFEALWSAVSEVDGVGIFNGGAIAGSSQPHKHMQVLPVFPSDNPSRPPIETVAMGHAMCSPGLVVSNLRGLGFEHSCLFVDDTLPPNKLGPWLYKHYQGMISDHITAGHVPTEPLREISYNIILTKKIMMFVPRSHDKCSNVAVNSLGYAGYLLIRDETDLKKTSPMTILAQCGFKRSEDGSCDTVGR